jgi:hypothetical protein
MIGEEMYLKYNNMRINLNDPADFTLEKVTKLIASGNDSIDTQFRVTSWPNPNEDYIDDF